MKTVTKNNRLIAEFMGLTIITDNISYFDTDYKPLRKYNSDWNWLMEAVGKIKPLISESEFKYRIGNDILTLKIEAVYNAVVSFIEWYNISAKEE